MQTRGIVHDRQGSIILMTLLMFFILCLLMILIMQLSVMEMHMSKYYYRTQQAQQLADAELEQRCAEISRYLQENCEDSATIPLWPLGWREKWTDYDAAGTSQCQTRFLKLETGADYCCYKLQCRGCFENAVKSVEAEVTFRFVSDYGPERALQGRTFTDGGVITSYNILYD